METPAQELRVQMLTVCYDFKHRLGILTSEPAKLFPGDQMIAIRIFETIDPEVEEIRIVPGADNFAGIVMRRQGPRGWDTATYDTREDFEDGA